MTFSKQQEAELERIDERLIALSRAKAEEEGIEYSTAFKRVAAENRDLIRQRNILWGRKLGKD